MEGGKAGEFSHHGVDPLTLERHWSKDQILDANLNMRDFRGGLRGAAAVAYSLFGKHRSGLSEAESVLPAAILPSPNPDSRCIGRQACRIAQSLAPGLPHPPGSAQGGAVPVSSGKASAPLAPFEAASGPLSCPELQARAVQVLTRPSSRHPRRTGSRSWRCACCIGRASACAPPWALGCSVSPAGPSVASCSSSRAAMPATAPRWWWTTPAAPSRRMGPPPAPSPPPRGGRSLARISHRGS
jgi:hypothetical protein